MFKKLCGEDGFHKFSLVTTMWQEVGQEVGVNQQTELERAYWAEMVKGGSTIKRFDGTKESAWAILDSLIDNESRKRITHIQEELVELRRDLQDTAAGQQLYSVGNVVEEQKDVLRQIESKLKDVLGRIESGLKGTTDPAVIQARVNELDELRRQRKERADLRRLDSSVIRRLLGSPRCI